MSSTDFMPIKGWDHLELYVGNAKQSAYYYEHALGFTQTAYAGPETGLRDRASYVLDQNDVRLVLTSGLRPDSEVTRFACSHGDGVKDVALTVPSATEAYRQAVQRGARSVVEPHWVEDEYGRVELASIATYGENIHTFVDRNDYAGPYLPGYRSVTENGAPATGIGLQNIDHVVGNVELASIATYGENIHTFVDRDDYAGPYLPGYRSVTENGAPATGIGLQNIDHVVGNVELGRMQHWVEFYERAFGMTELIHFTDKAISTEYSALMSKVMMDGEGKIKFPINEPAEGKRKSQIEEYLDFYGGPGVQHVALATDDIVATVEELEERGLRFLKTPTAYYDDLEDRVGEIDADYDDLKRLGILADRDEEGYLLQIFTKTAQDRPTLFFEVIERHGSRGFGEGNFKALFEAIEREQALRGNL
jgi:4-hydroxyphenylpyruvate dioxygenase